MRGKQESVMLTCLQVELSWLAVASFAEWAPGIFLWFLQSFSCVCLCFRPQFTSQRRCAGPRLRAQCGMGSVHTRPCTTWPRCPLAGASSSWMEQVWVTLGTAPDPLCTNVPQHTAPAFLTAGSAGTALHFLGLQEGPSLERSWAGALACLECGGADREAVLVFYSDSFALSPQG